MILLFVSGTARAQRYTSSSRKAIKSFEEAVACFQASNDACTEENLQKAIRWDPGFLEAYQLLAQVCFDQGRVEDAIRYFGRSLDIDPEGNPDGYRLLARLILITGDYSRALELIDKFLAFPPDQVNLREEGFALKKSVLFALDAIAHPVPFQPENLGPAVNSEFSEYWPSLSVDEEMLMFTVLLPVNQPGVEGPGAMQEDFYYSMRSGDHWDPRLNAGAPLNSPDNEGAQTITADGATLYFTACNRREGQGMCDIYRSEWVDGQWSNPVNLGDPVNTRYSEKHPTISADGRRLFFASNRPGGKGSFDIWVSERTSQGWSLPVNLGDSVNTPGMEQSPFMHPDQQSLYFSSTGWPGMGQGDLFITRMKDTSGWSAPENLGFPINTHNDEIGLTVNANGDRAYFASDRESGTDTDLYTFVLPEWVRPVQVSYMTGRVYDSQNMKGIRALLQLIDLETEATVMELKSGGSQGDYLISLPTDRDYALNVSAEGYLFHSDHFAFSGLHGRQDPLRRDIPMDRITVGSSVILHNIFFGTDSYKLLPASMAELNKIYEFLRLNPAIEVEIGGHTDNTGTAEHNQELSDRRAGAVVEYLLEKGIAREKLKTSGYGDRVPVADNSSEEGRALNRRTELKITGVQSGSAQ